LPVGQRKIQIRLFWKIIWLQNFIFILWKFLQMPKLLCNALKISGGGKMPPLVARLMWMYPGVVVHNQKWSNHFPYKSLLTNHQMYLWPQHWSPPQNKSLGVAPTGDSKGGLGGYGPPHIFDWPPACPPVFCLISRSNSLDWPIQQITFGQQYFTFMLAPLLFSLAPQWHPTFFILESPLVAPRHIIFSFCPSMLKIHQY